MNRRDVILAAIALGTWPVQRGAGAQNPKPQWRIGHLIATDGPDFPKLHDALRLGLRDLGFVAGQNVEILVRSADGNADRYPVLVADLVQQGVDVIFTTNTPATMAAKAGAPATPIVFAGVGDPVAFKLVKSLSHPGGQVTGLTLLTPELTPKRLELLKEAVPQISRVAALWNPGIEGHRQELQSLESTARSLGMQLQSFEVRRPEDLEGVFASITRERADGLVVLASPLHHRSIRQIAELALKHRLPAICEFSEFTGVGGLMVYGPSWSDMYRQAATYVAKILKGADPGSLPVLQPTQFELVINDDTARRLGLRIPQSVRMRARG